MNCPLPLDFRVMGCYSIRVVKGNHPMRKIETQMCQAIQSNKDWRSGNTRVIYSPIHNTSEVYLHNNLIAIVTDDALQILDGGWQSNTTKSRLNAILSECGVTGERVFQQNFEWFVRLWNGTEFFVTNFRSGMRLA